MAHGNLLINIIRHKKMKVMYSNVAINKKIRRIYFEGQNFYQDTKSNNSFYLAERPAFAEEKPLMRSSPFELPRGIYFKKNIPEETPKTLKLEAIFTIKG
jgi:hypothetical protein